MSDPLVDERTLGDTVGGIFASHAGDDATAALAAFGVTEFIDHDPAAAVRLVFTQQGSVAARSNALAILMSSRLRAGVGAGAQANVMFATDAADGVGTNTVAEDGSATLSGLSLGLVEGGDLLIPMAIGPHRGGVGLVTLRSNTPGLRITPVGGIDPGLGAWRAEGARLAPTTVDRSLAAGDAWSDALAWGRAALAAEIIGSARTALDLALEHAKQRVQFGQPIGAFQAVKHRLADVFIAIEAGQAAVDAALSEPSPLASMVAKSMSGRAGRLAASGCLQVLGAIGFTEDHPFHRYQRRILALDRLLGSADQLPALIGQDVLVRGEGPVLVTLGEE